MLFEAVRRDSSALDCDVRVFRDIADSETALQAIVEEEGFLRMPAPESLVLSEMGADAGEHHKNLTYKQRRHQSTQVRPYNDSFHVEVLSAETRRLSKDEAMQLSQLYENVKTKSLELNTFALPSELIPTMVNSPGWEILLFRPADDPGGPCSGFLASYVAHSGYVPLLVGMDYEYVAQRGLYRQVLRQCIVRARALGKERVLYGFAASLEKRRFGARPVASSMFIDAQDDYAFATLAQISSETV